MGEVLKLERPRRRTYQDEVARQREKREAERRKREETPNCRCVMEPVFDGSRHCEVHVVWDSPGEGSTVQFSKSDIGQFVEVGEWKPTEIPGLPELTIDDVRGALVNLARREGEKAMLDLLFAYGLTQATLHLLPREYWAALMADADDGSADEDYWEYEDEED